MLEHLPFVKPQRGHYALLHIKFRNVVPRPRDHSHFFLHDNHLATQKSPQDTIYFPLILSFQLANAQYSFSSIQISAFQAQVEDSSHSDKNHNIFFRPRIIFRNTIILVNCMNLKRSYRLWLFQEENLVKDTFMKITFEKWSFFL